MSFIKYLKETEELEINQELENKKEAIRALFTAGEKVTDEMANALAEDLGIEYAELESIIFDLLTELLTVDIPDEEEVDDIEDVGLDDIVTDTDDDFIEI